MDVFLANCYSNCPDAFREEWLESNQFYKSAFDTEVEFKIESPDGAIVARLSVKGAQF